jgi:hypothetical protein
VSSGTNEKPKLVITEHSPKTMEYIRELNGYLDALEGATGEAALTRSTVFDLTPGKKVGIIYGIRTYWGRVVKYEPPILYLANRYGHVMAFNLTKAAGIVQDKETVLEKARKLYGAARDRPPEG